MVNAWSLAASILDGTLDKDYPIMTDIKINTGVGKTTTYNVPLTETNPNGDVTIRTGDTSDYEMTGEGIWWPKDTTETYPVEHSDAWYDYTRNDPDRENPFTDPEDWVRAESVVGSGNTASDYPSSFNTFSVNDDQMAHHVGLNYEELNLNIHANSPYNSGYEQEFYKEELKKMTDSRNKYHEKEILKDVEDYVSGTYNGHYTGTKHEFRNVQTLDLMASRDLASDFCQANILKYGSRYGSKDGRNKKDLLKVIHYAMLLLHFDEHYGKPSMTSGNIDHNMP